MLNTLILAAVAGVGFIVAWLLTPLLRRYALQRGWYKPLRPRDLHTTPIPRIGGLAIFAGFTVAVLTGVALGFLNYWRGDDLWRIGLLLLGASIITAVMVVDDLRELRPLTKLFWQAVAAFVIIIPQLFNPDGQAGILIDTINNPLGGVFNLKEVPILAVALTVFWVMGMMNTINFIDGMDGLAAGVVFIGAVILFLENVFSGRNFGTGFHFTSSLLALALAAATLGFLPFNWYPARIFMGDSGANFLGYALAVIAIIDGAKLATALLVVGLPVLDTGWVIFYRRYRGNRATGADTGHIHHRLLELGYSQRQIVLFIYTLTIVFGVVGILIPQQTWIKVLALVVLVVSLSPVLYYSIRARRKTVEKKSGETLE